MIQSGNFYKRILLVLLAVAFTALIAGTGVRAQEIVLKAEPAKELSDKAVEASGVAFISRSEILVADDKDKLTKQHSLLFVSVENGVVGERLSMDASESLPDWEGIAQVGNNYYLVGSNSALYTFSYNSKAKKISLGAKYTIVRPQELLAKKFEVEGLAVRKLGQLTELALGIRDRDADLASVMRNSEKIQVYRTVINTLTSNDQVLQLTEFFQFDARMTQAAKWHLSSIDYVPALRGFLIMTSTEISPANVFYGNRLWFVPEKSLSAPKSGDRFANVTPLRSHVFETEMKAEGLAVLSCDEKLKTVTLVIVYDNDFMMTKIGTKFQIVEVSLTSHGEFDAEPCRTPVSAVRE